MWHWILLFMNHLEFYSVCFEPTQLLASCFAARRTSAAFRTARRRRTRWACAVCAGQPDTSASTVGSLPPSVPTRSCSSRRRRSGPSPAGGWFRARADDTRAAATHSATSLPRFHPLPLPAQWRHTTVWRQRPIRESIQNRCNSCILVEKWLERFWAGKQEKCFLTSIFFSSRQKASLKRFDASWTEIVKVRSLKVVTVIECRLTKFNIEGKW